MMLITPHISPSFLTSLRSNSDPTTLLKRPSMAGWMVSLMTQSVGGVLRPWRRRISSWTSTRRTLANSKCSISKRKSKRARRNLITRRTYVDTSPRGSYESSSVRDTSQNSGSFVHNKTVMLKT